MSQLYKKYVTLKVQNSRQLYLFKSGIFYIFLDEDAKLMSPILGLKLTNLNSTIVKCGFPTSQLEKYTRLISISNYSFKIIDSKENISYLPSEYIIKDEIKNLVLKIANINSENLSISSAFDFIDEISSECKNILKGF